MSTLGLFEDRGADFSDCGCYRYRLWRTWDAAPPAVFVMLNPSTADALTDDPTIRRCRRYALEWGYGGLVVVNLFAWMATDPTEMLSAADPVGPCNDDHIISSVKDSGVVLCAWGNHGSHMDRAAKVHALIKSAGVDPMVLRLTKLHQPAHPLYLPSNLVPAQWINGLAA
ncbi:DUF1643 domain-containing protein [Endothiovibrio diazotrophicus]